MNKDLEKINDFTFKIAKSGKMHVDCILYLNEKLANSLEDKAVEQVKNVATLPGIIDRSIAMSDIHVGYGFSIGGVAAFDADTGIISPGGIGFDINCGVRTIVTDLVYDDIKDKTEMLVNEIFDAVPCGVGSESKIRLTHSELDEVLKNGGKWALEKGYGDKSDVECCEESGCLKDANPTNVTPTAKARGKNQLGTLGAGNHFLEIQIVDEIKNPAIAEVFGIHKKKQVLIMIHTGSRGLGHQVCTDYIREMQKEHPDIFAKLPDKDLIYAPINSIVGKNYFSAMCASANFAWANRQIISHEIKNIFRKHFPDVTLTTLYDVAHNIAKKEKYNGRELIVHRKGATRAFGAGHLEIPEKYREVGQPVLIPGSMGTSSYILCGTNKAEDETFGSTCHGAGRTMSRFSAMKQYSADEIKKELASKHILVKSASKNGIVEEAPECYKDVDEVIKTVEGAGIAKVIVKLTPVGVIKG